MADKAENGYFVTIEEIETNEIVKYLGPYTENKANRIANAVRHQTNTDRFHVDYDWFGPQQEQTT